jgi:hypothetical protein
MTMGPAKQSALEADGWHFGTVAEFLGLTPEEEAEVERRLRACPTRSRSEVRRAASMVEGERKAKGRMRDS